MEKTLVMISFSTGKLRKIRGQNWENKLVKTSDELVISFKICENVQLEKESDLNIAKIPDAR